MLSHALTPGPLTILNDKLERLLHLDFNESNNEQCFAQLVSQRHDFIVEYLTQLTDQARSSFVSLELVSAEQLTQRAVEKRNEIKQTLSSLSRKKRAIQKFK